MARQIPLTQGQFATVDDEDFERVNRYKWFAAWAENTQSFYAQRSVNTHGKITTVRMHHFILGARRVDHLNGLTLDNQRLNLRRANRRQNSMNRKKRSDNTSGFKGVSWHGQQNKWTVRIMPTKGKSQLVGLFPEDKKIEAARAYDRAAIRYHGQFARLNFPREDYTNG